MRTPLIRTLHVVFKLVFCVLLVIIALVKTAAEQSKLYARILRFLFRQYWCKRTNILANQEP